MFSYQSVNGANMVSLEDWEKWEFLKNDFLPKMFFQNIGNFLLLFKTMIYPKHNLANSTFLGLKDTDISKKEVNPLRG